MLQGFRKVNPDQWEFAHAFFLRGQTQLLQHIVRRNSNSNNCEKKKEAGNEAGTGRDSYTCVDGYASAAREVANLKKEQKELEAELDRMWRRVKDTERRPSQTMAFLVKVVQDPSVLDRLVGAREVPPKRARLCYDNSKKDGSCVWPLDCDGSFNPTNVDLDMNWINGF